MNGTADSFELSTARLLLRPFKLQDVSRYHDILTQPQVRRFLLDDSIVEADWVAAEIQRSLELFQTNRFGTWALNSVECGDIIGFCGFRFFFEDPELQLFYGLDSAHWGQGLATEAATAVIRYAFEVLAFEEVIAATDPPNTASIRVLERLGMTNDGEIIHDGKPTRYFSVTRRGFEERFRQISPLVPRNQSP